MTPGSALAIIVIGGTGIAAQILLLRELFVSFLGNELTFGLILGAWILWEALGSLLGRRIQWSLGKVLWTQVAFSSSLFLGLVLSRCLKAVLFGPWGLGGYGEILFVSSLACAAPALLHGALFPGCCWLAGDRVGSAYLYETLGTVAGAIALGYLAIPSLGAAQVVILIFALSMALGILLGKGAWYGLITALALTAVPFASPLEKGLLEGRWPGYRVEKAVHSPYAHLALLSRGGEETLLYNGVPTLTLPHYDPWAALTVHLPLLLHPHPQKVLFIGPAVGGRLREALKHPLREVHWVERDRAILELLADRGPVEEALSDRRVRFVQDDPRRWLRRERGYDLIFVTFGLPSDLQGNRLFTLEALRTVGESLRDGGILVYELEGSPTYMGAELEGVYCTLLSTLRQVFPHVTFIVAEKSMALASSMPLEDRLRSAGERLRALRLLSPILTPQGLPYYLSRRYTPPSACPSNEDGKPVLVYKVLRYEGALYGPALSDLLARLEGSNPLWFLVPFAGLSLLMALPLRKRVPAVIATTGVSAMAGELLLVYLFQTSHGSLYLWIGLLLASFMLGAALGAGVGRDRGSRMDLLVADGVVVAFFALLYLTCPWEIPPWGYVGSLSLLGGLAGWQFSVGSNLLGKGGEVGGRLYFWDLLGGLLGALVVPICSLPLWGFAQTALIIMALKGMTFLALLRR